MKSIRNGLNNGIFQKFLLELKKNNKKDRRMPKSTAPINGHLKTILKPNNIFFQLTSLSSIQNWTINDNYMSQYNSNLDKRFVNEYTSSVLSNEK